MTAESSKNGWKRRALRAADLAADVIIIAVGLGAVYLLLNVFVYATFKIPTGSMLPTIRPGDRVVVEKLSGGARLFDIFDAAAGLKVNVRRMPHWRDFGRGDLLVFNFPHCESWDTMAMNPRVYYFKRCIAAPGDTLQISNFAYIVGGDTLRGYPSRREFECCFPDDSTGRADRVRGYMADLSDTIDRWTVRDFGPLVVPRRGLTMVIDSTNRHRYRQLIEWETGHRADSMAHNYTFTHDYYFMAGDNALASMDSRYWGLVPDDFVVGRARLIWWSEDKHGIRWKRILKSIR